MRQFLLLSAALCVSIPVHASLIQITAPTTAYVNSTTKLNISGANGATVLSVTDGILITTFSHARQVQRVPDGGWSTWSAAPYAEESNPTVLAAYGYNSALTSLSFYLSGGVSTFGFEAEGDPYGSYLYTVEYFNGSTSLGTITAQIEGNSGARLLAVSSTTPITSATVSSNVDFAVAQLRYATAIPEPSTALLFGLGFAAIPAYRRLSRRS